MINFYMYATIYCLLLETVNLCSEIYGYTRLRTNLFAGVVVYEYELKIGWGKSVALPSQALPAPPPGQMAIRSKEVFLLSSSFRKADFIIMLDLLEVLIVQRLFHSF